MCETTEIGMATRTAGIERESGTGVIIEAETGTGATPTTGAAAEMETLTGGEAAVDRTMNVGARTSGTKK